MGTPSPTPDPGAATDVPRERARLPLQAEGRDWFRRGRQAEREDFDLIPDAEAPARQGLAVGVVQVTPEPPAEDERQQAALEAVTERLEEADTDHGQGTPIVPKQRPHANLDYEERVCRLLEDLVENTRLINLRLAAEEHRRNVADAGTLDLQPQPTGLWATLRAGLGWVRDPNFRKFVAQVFVAGSTAGGSLVGSASTMMLIFELVERLLRAWVELP